MMAAPRADLSDSDKAAIIELICEGYSTKDIAELLPEVSEPSIAAYRAHVTRGTYEGNRP